MDLGGIANFRREIDGFQVVWVDSKNSRGNAEGADIASHLRMVDLTWKENQGLGAFMHRKTITGQAFCCNGRMSHKFSRVVRLEDSP